MYGPDRPLRVQPMVRPVSQIVEVQDSRGQVDGVDEEIGSAEKLTSGEHPGILLGGRRARGV